MWAYLNYDSLWGVAHTRKQAKDELAKILFGDDWDALHRVDEELVSGSITIKRCMVRLIPKKKRKKRS